MRMVELEELDGVGPAIAEKLRQAGYDSIESIAVATTGELMEAIEIGMRQAVKIINAAREASKMGYERAIDVFERRKNLARITTGSQTLDRILGGGVETLGVTELFGEFGSGKCVAGDTLVLYFNSSVPHLESIEEVYRKYERISGETPFENGFVVRTPDLEVIGFVDGGFKKIRAPMLYRERVGRVLRLRTRRGRMLELSGMHMLLTFDGGLKWKRAFELGVGDLVAVPKTMGEWSDARSGIGEDDAYFLGFFVAEGTRNPLSVTTSDGRLRDWIVGYVERRFGFSPTVVEVRRKSVAHQILLRKKVADELLGELSLKKSGEKRVPESVLAGDLNVVRAFLAGYLEGDGYLSDGTVEVTTKSKRLATEVGYLFLRIGIHVTKSVKNVRGERYFRLFITGDDRYKLEDLPFKSKVAPRRSRAKAQRHGYPGEMAAYLRDLYKKTLGGGRGSLPKLAEWKPNRGETFYHVLTRSRFDEIEMTETTFARVKEFFEEGFKRLAQLRQELPGLTWEGFKKFYRRLPFSFRVSMRNAGFSGSSVSNFLWRGPKDQEFMDRVKEALRREIDRRLEILADGLRTIGMISELRWDRIEKIETVPYDGFVYDFVVPEGHTFIGGDLPTVMHNSQIAHQLCVNVQLPPEQGGLGGRAVFIDTENTFRPERISQMAMAVGVDPKVILDGIYVARAHTTDHQMLLAEKVSDMAKTDGIKLLVIDSLTALFRTEYCGRGALAERQQKLGRHIAELHKVAELNGMAVVVTNQVQARPDVFFGDPTRPVGGHVLGHAVTARVYLKKAKANSRTATLVDHPCMPPETATFQITEAGIRD